MNWLIWALFGNDLDGVDASSEQGREWRPDLPVGSWKCRVLWWFRNPFHNFMFHVIGVVDPETNQIKAGWARGKEFWAVGGGWLFTAARKGWIALPFVSYWNKHFECYFGWRERGNFGIALRKR